MPTHLASDDLARGLCGHRHHGRIAPTRDAATCSYCRHVAQHGGRGIARGGIDRALYEMGNHGGVAYRAVGD